MLPTTDVWDVAQLYDVDVNSDEFKELLVRLYQNVNNIALAVNLKDTGYYTLQEFLNSQAYFANPALSSSTPQAPVLRQVFRKVINFGALPNAGAKSVAHNIPITSGYSFTRIYGTASDQSAPRSFIPLPYASAAGDNIELQVDDTDVIITTTIDRTNYTICYVVLEYVKS